MIALLRTLVAFVLATGALAARAEPLAIRDAWVRATPPGVRTAAAYLTIENSGAADRLLGASSPAAQELELHTHVTEAGMQRMVRLTDIALPAGATVRLEPGGLHFMLLDIAAPLAPGTAVALRLRFANAAAIDVVTTVIDARTAPTPAPAPGHAAH